MKCVRCTTELPGQAQFCLKCGTPVGSMPSAAPGAIGASARPSAIRMASPAKTGPNKGLIAGALAGLVILAAAGYFGYRNLTGRADAGPTGSNVLNKAGRAADGSGLLGAGARIGSSGPLTASKGANDTPVDTTSIMDYLKFLKEIEGQRLTLQKKQIADVMTQMQLVQAGTIGSQMQEGEDNIAKMQNDTYKELQKTMSNVSTEWNTLSQKFASRTPPQSCQQLANSYYDGLGKASSATIQVMNKFSQAMGGLSKGDTGSVTSIVEGLKEKDGKGMGSFSKEVDDAFNRADSELAAVCDKFRIHKDFDIKPDGGGSNPFGMGM